MHGPHKVDQISSTSCHVHSISQLECHCQYLLNLLQFPLQLLRIHQMVFWSFN
jgi:hypothetical protein